MPSTHRDQGHHRDQTIQDDAVRATCETLDIETQADTDPNGVDAGRLRLRSRDGYLPERAAAAGGVQAAEYMTSRPPSGGVYHGDGNLWIHSGLPGLGLLYADYLYAMPFVLPFSLQIDAAIFWGALGDLGKEVHFGLYDARPDENLPRNLLKEFGPTTWDPAVNILTWETTLNPGYYFWCLNTNSNAGKLRVINPFYTRHTFYSTTSSNTPLTRVYYSLAFSSGLPATWAENDEAYTYEIGSAYAFGVRAA